MQSHLAALTVFLLCLPIIATGTVIHVPDDMPTIQAGIDAAVNGDTVLVSDGRYTGAGNRNIDFLGKAITVISENGPVACIIDCEQQLRGFQLHSGEGLDSVIQGFTITNAYFNPGNWPGGGGVYCIDSSPTITDCIIVGNASQTAGGIKCENSSASITGCAIIRNEGIVGYSGVHLLNFDGLFSGNLVAENYGANHGGGVSVVESAGLVSNNIITGNWDSSYGAGVYVRESSTTIVNNLVFSNHADNDGGGLYLWDSPDADIRNNTVAGNIANRDGGGIFAVEGTAPDVTSCIIWGNTPENIEVDGGGSLAGVTFSDVGGGYAGVGNIDADPLFTAGPGASYFLSQLAAGQPADSSCVDTGRPFGPLVDGSTRTDMVLDSGVVDMGWHAASDTSIIIGGGPDVLSFVAGYNDDPPPDKWMAVWHSGSIGAMNWSVSDDAHWLTLTPSSGISYGEQVPITAHVDQAGLPPGLYEATVEVTDPWAGNSPLLLTVSLEVVAAVLEHDPDSLVFDTTVGGAPPSGQLLSIWNDGTDSMVWSVSDDVDWLSLSPDSGNSSGEVDQVTVTVDQAGLPLGFYSGTITIEAPGANPTSATVPVTMAVLSDDVYQVPGDFPTIQDAIDAAVHGDTVIVADGTWTGPGNRDLDFGGRNITVRSANGREFCTIDCEGSYSVEHFGFRFHSGENRYAVVDGFRIFRAHGSATIVCENASATIRNCLIAGEPWLENVGIHCINSEAVIENCLVYDNYWGGIACVSSSLVIEDTVVTGNGSAIYGGSGPGGFAHYGNYDSKPSRLTNVLISSNQARSGGCVDASGSLVFNNCTIADNWSFDGHEFVYGGEDLTLSNSIITGDITDYESGMVMSYCCVEDGWPGEGNIDADPLFVSGPGGGYYLSQLTAGQPVDSPCVDAGNPSSEVPSGTTRTDHDADTGVGDMGYHYPQTGLISCGLTCVPGSGTLPFQLQFTVMIENPGDEFRRVAGTLDASIAGGTNYSAWRVGWTNLDPAEVFSFGWSQYLPALGTLVGDNVFNLATEDVTPAPYNQPPYAPSGDTGSAGCTVTGIAP